MKSHFDVIIVGGGHAGVEAAWAAAHMGANTLLVTLDRTKVATMPCNPSLGGLGKGHIVFEVSALSGLMPKLCTTTYLQARMLNTRKGPAVQGLRVQIDKFAYSASAHQALENCPNLTIFDGMVTTVLTEQTGESKRIAGVSCADGTTFYAPSVVITTGTFMNGLVHVGRTRYQAGRRGEAGVYGLSASLGHAMGVSIGRLKTGTPPRLLKSTLNYEKFEAQTCEKLEYLYDFDPVTVTEKIPCFITTTNQETHDIIRKNLDLSALYSKNIKGIGPRYCPSIEDKVGRYPEREAHHVFIEPEGADSDEIYPAGLSTSLPLEVQIAYIRSINGFERAEIAKCGYAIEYDFIQPTNLKHTLETKQVSGLFLAGQINGTTGYEEAAGQGLVAGINAVLHAQNKDPFILSRSESYIGVMIDDLVTLGADEPYRMFTSRAERRLLLRQDNAFIRLMPYAKQFGLIDDILYQKYIAEKEIIEKSVALIYEASRFSEIFKAFHVVDFTEVAEQYATNLLLLLLQEKNIQTTALSGRAILCIHAEIRYDGYLEKEKNEVEKVARYQQLAIPETIEYRNMPGLTRELQHKLIHCKPATIAQATLIPGMTPAALSILIFQSRMIEKRESVINKGEY
jgi:tRNA uridine 5-carboxymethylaminomethyl modification enzyme